MGASDSKLDFKQGIFKLSERKNIPADDSYWTSFWELPDSVEDVFSLFSPADIRRIRDESLENFETLILAITSRLFALRHNQSFPSAESAPERDALNCIRVLTRLLPYIYEAEHLENWEERFFWGTRRRRRRRVPEAPEEVIFDGESNRDPHADTELDHEEAQSLAEELIYTLMELLFYSGFTIPSVSNSKDRVKLAIWQSGVGCTGSIGTSAELESNRMEILRLLLTICSKSMYTSANVLPVQGVRALTYITTIDKKPLTLTLLCSLLNTTLKYNPATWHVPYDHIVFKDPKQIFVTYCLQLLLVLILYPVPETSSGKTPRNDFRHYLSKLHRPQDFQFLIDGMTRVLNQPLQATTTYLPGSQKSITWAPEMIMLFWEVLQCNKRFRSFIIDTDRAHDFMVLVLFYALQHRNDPAQQGIVRMCVFVLQTLSVEPTFGSRLNKRFQGQDSLPQNIRLPGFRGSYLDFLLVSISNLIMTSKGKLDAIYPALLAVINNVAPHASELDSTSSSKLMQLFGILSSPDFLFAGDGNHEILKSLLEALNAIIENQYEKNPVFIYAILRSRKRFYALRDLMENGAQNELERHARKRKELAENIPTSNSPRRSPSMEGTRTPNSQAPSSLRNIDEAGGAFSIGDDDGSESEQDNDTGSKRTPSRSPNPSEPPSRQTSISSPVDDAVPSQTRAMSEKARGKLPMGQSSFSRQGSNASLMALAMGSPIPGGNFEPTVPWVESWLPELPLHTILATIDQLAPKMPASSSASSSNSNSASRRHEQQPPEAGSSSAPTSALNIIRRTRLQDLDRSTLRIHLFEWSPLSLGWYESLLWGFIFSSEMTLFKGAAGIWKGTSIKLFKVQETAAHGPSLLAPKGAVDAVGSNLVQKIGNLNFRSASGSGAGAGSGAGGVGGGQGEHRNTAGGVVRDV
ncbi:MAG: hypothetical protein M1831_000591 [Alyxoria varia]|nr:MAG: hypothetical protein M1831_000591 [Alyxoria varia]